MKITEMTFSELMKICSQLAIVVIAVVLVVSMPLLFTTEIDSWYVQVTDDVKKIADDIKEKCDYAYPYKDSDMWHIYYPYYQECLEHGVRDFVLFDINTYQDTVIENWLNLNNDVTTTLTRGGDCENKAILAASILKALDKKKLYIIGQVGKDEKGGHACWAIQDERNMRFYNCYHDLDIINIKLIE